SSLSDANCWAFHPSRMVHMTTRGSDELFEFPTEAGGDAYEDPDLQRRTDFQSRGPRSGADFKAMAINRLRDAGSQIERLDFEIDGLPVDALIAGRNGRRFLVLARGTPAEGDQSGLRRTDTVEKMGFMAMQPVDKAYRSWCCRRTSLQAGPRQPFTWL